MKRDMDLVRQILLELEGAPAGQYPNYPLVVDGYDESTVAAHLVLLDEAGLINANVTSVGDGSVRAIPFRLTWPGHDFLDAARSESIWNQARQRIGQSIETASFHVFTTLLYALAKEKLGL